MMEHSEGDGCRVFHPDYELTVIGRREATFADEVDQGDFVRDRLDEVPDRWFRALEVARYGPAKMHFLLVQASAGDVERARRDYCLGHVATQGAVNSTFYCDGSCA